MRSSIRIAALAAAILASTAACSKDSPTTSPTDAAAPTVGPHGFGHSSSAASPAPAPRLPTTMTLRCYPLENTPASCEDSGGTLGGTETAPLCCYP